MQRITLSYRLWISFCLKVDLVYYEYPECWLGALAESMVLRSSTQTNTFDYMLMSQMNWHFDSPALCFCINTSGQVAHCKAYLSSTLLHSQVPLPRRGLDHKSAFLITTPKPRSRSVTIQDHQSQPKISTLSNKLLLNSPPK
jgi:hypothetical protein